MRALVTAGLGARAQLKTMGITKNNGNCSFNQSPTLDICENECLRCNNMVPEQIIHGILWYFGIFSDYHASKVEQNMFQSDTLLFWMYCEMSPVDPFPIATKMVCALRNSINQFPL